MLNFLGSVMPPQRFKRINMDVYNEINAHRIKKCARKNDEFRESLNPNHITHEIVYLRSKNKMTERTGYQTQNRIGTIQLCNKIFRCCQVNQILKDIKNYKAFDYEFDPHHEHFYGDIFYKYLDFESLSDNGPKYIRKPDQMLWFKIEYYDSPDMIYHPDNHLTQNVYRVLKCYISKE